MALTLPPPAFGDLGISDDDILIAASRKAPRVLVREEGKLCEVCKARPAYFNGMDLPGHREATCGPCFVARARRNARRS